jgi:hypothetical protein
MKILTFLVLLLSFKAHAITCSSIIKSPLDSQPSLYSAKNLMDSGILYSTYFVVTVAKTVREISSNGIRESMLKNIVDSGNLADLEPIANLIYINMSTSSFPSRDARTYFERVPENIMIDHILDALLLNAKYKEEVSVTGRGDHYGIETSGEMAAELGMSAALPIWVSSAFLSLATGDGDILVAGGVLTLSSLAVGIGGIYRSLNAGRIAGKTEDAFKKKVVKDLSTIRTEARAGQQTPLLMLVMDNVIKAKIEKLNEPAPEPIPSILF